MSIRLAGICNGKDAADSPQQLYFVSSADGGRSFSVGNGGSPIIVKGSPGTWYSQHIAQACLIAVTGGYELWASGYNGRTWAIGRWTSSTLNDDPASWFADGANPIITKGAAGQPDDANCNIPMVEYDAGLRRIWYTGWKVGGKTTGCYAEVDAGGMLTKYAKVIDVGASGDFDHEGVSCGPPLTVGGEKRVYYTGQAGTTYPDCSQGYATYTDPRDAGTYTKRGQLPSLAGIVTLDGAYRSQGLSSIVPWQRRYIGLLSVFHPDGSTNQREITGYTVSRDGLTWTASNGPVVPMATAYPSIESRENPAVLRRLRLRDVGHSPA